MVFFFGFLQQFTVGVFLSWECPADPAISINDKNNKRSSVLFWGGEYYFVHRNPSSLFFFLFLKFWQSNWWPVLTWTRRGAGECRTLMPIKTHMDERLFPLDNMTSSDVGAAKKESRLLQKVSVSKKKRRDLFFGEIFRRAVSNGPKSGIVIRSAANIGF